ncbi:MAG: DUF3800 domain-containing protein [Candidatus Bipolaricaulis sp.]|nr:DUF3800 domain-containing protein [Candidatus Bipolaricaulis sp.]
MFTHVLYVDDSGTKEYAVGTRKYGRGNSRYFVYGGVLIRIADSGRLSERLITLKLECFGDDTVEVKSDWLRIPKERKLHYLEPYGLTDEKLDIFVSDFYGAVIQTDLLLIAAVIDKVHMQEDYPPNPWYPPAVAYEILAQRVENELRGHGVATVSIDDTSGATPHGNQYSENLRRHHARLISYGSALQRGFTFTSLGPRIKLVDSARSHMIQVADLVAYNVFRQFVEHGEEWETMGLGKLPTYDYFRRIAGKFRADSRGVIQGYGVIKFPTRSRVQWARKKRKGAP